MKAHRKWQFVVPLASLVLVVVLGCGELEGPQGPAGLPGVGTITGNVLDATSTQPISNAIVTAFPTTTSRLPSRQMPGTYSLSVPAGDYRAVAVAEGYQSGEQTVSVEAGQTAIANFFLNPGIGRATYVGSPACSMCHPDKYQAWQDTLHSRMIQSVSAVPSPILRDPAEGMSELGLSDEAALGALTYTVGSHWEQRFMFRDGEEFYFLPVQWVVAHEEWEPFQAAAYRQRPWSKHCQGCHSTGFTYQTRLTNEISIGCEGCHGPGSSHISAGGDTSLIINPEHLGFERENMVCGACHNRGASTQTFPGAAGGNYEFPVGFRPGDGLEEIGWNPTTSSADLYRDGSARRHRMQYLDWKLSVHSRVGVGCNTCHDAHGSQFEWSLRQDPDDNSLCTQCHTDRITASDLGRHTHHGTDLSAAYPGSRCTKCHMPLQAKSAVEYDIHSHTFNFISPGQTVDALTADPAAKRPNSCMAGGCHSTAPGAGGPDWDYTSLSDAQDAADQVEAWW